MRGERYGGPVAGRQWEVMAGRHWFQADAAVKVRLKLDPASRRFYSTLSLVSGAAAVPLGYISLFSIGLALLVLVIAAAALGAILVPS